MPTQKATRCPRPRPRSLAAQRIRVAALPCLFAAITMLACARPQRQDPADLPYRTGTIEHHDNGKLRKGKLIEPTEIAGLPAEHWAHFYDNGTAKGFRLAQDSVVAGHRLPKRSYLWFDDQGRFRNAWLSEDVEIDGVQCDGGPWKVSTYFYPSGRLKTVFLAKDAVIQGVPCKASVLHSVRFDEDSNLIECTLSHNATLAGVAYRRGDRVQIPR